MQQVQCSFCQFANIAGNAKCTNCGGPLPVTPAATAQRAVGYAQGHANPGFANPAHANQVANWSQASSPASPSGATAIAAGVFATIIGLLELFSFVIEVAFLELMLKYSPLSVVFGFLGLIVGIVLITGSIMVFAGKKAGPLLVAGGSGVVVISTVLGLVGMRVVYGPGPFTVLVLLLALLTMTFALIPPTRRWIAWKGSRRAAVAKAYPRPY